METQDLNLISSLFSAFSAFCFFCSYCLLLFAFAFQQTLFCDLAMCKSSLYHHAHIMASTHTYIYISYMYIHICMMPCMVCIIIITIIIMEMVLIWWMYVCIYAYIHTYIHKCMHAYSSILACLPNAIVFFDSQQHRKDANFMFLLDSHLSSGTQRKNDIGYSFYPHL